MKTIGDRIIFLRENVDLSQVKLAELIGITKMTLYKYEKNICEPKGEVIAKMADALNTTTDFLLGRTSNYAPLHTNKSEEKIKTRETELISNFRKLTENNKIKIEERIQTLLEQQ